MNRTKLNTLYDDRNEINYFIIYAQCKNKNQSKVQYINEFLQNQKRN